MSESKEKQIWKEPAFLVGIGLTVLVLFSFSYTLFVWPMNDEYTSKWAYLRNAQPNEIGDTLAGVAGTLAFVWIVVTVWLQATELREQRQEFRRMATAQESQATVLEKQKKIFEDEQKQRDETRAEQLLNEKLRSFIVKIIESPSKGLHWSFSNAPIDDEYGSYGEVISRSLNGDGYEMKTVDEAVIDFRRTMRGLRNNLLELMPQSIDYRMAENALVLSGLVDRLKEADALKDQLSASQQERLARLGLNEIAENLHQLAATSELWKDEDT